MSIGSIWARANALSQDGVFDAKDVTEIFEQASHQQNDEEVDTLQQLRQTFNKELQAHGGSVNLFEMMLEAETGDWISQHEMQAFLNFVPYAGEEQRDLAATKSLESMFESQLDSGAQQILDAWQAKYDTGGGGGGGGGGNVWKVNKMIKRASEDGQLGASEVADIFAQAMDDNGRIDTEPNKHGNSEFSLIQNLANSSAQFSNLSYEMYQVMLDAAQGGQIGSGQVDSLQQAAGDDLSWQDRRGLKTMLKVFGDRFEFQARKELARFIRNDNDWNHHGGHGGHHNNNH